MPPWALAHQACSMLQRGSARGIQLANGFRKSASTLFVGTAVSRLIWIGAAESSLGAHQIGGGGKSAVGVNNGE